MNARRFTSILIISAMAVMLLAVGGSVAVADAPGAGELEWYCAEGSTAVSIWGTYMTYISIANTGAADANVDIEFQTPEGPIVMPTFVVDSTSATTVCVNDQVPNNWSVSTHVTSDEPVVVDRYMLYQRPGEPAPEPRSYAWAHGSVGVNMPSFFWCLAEGSTGGDETGSFETWILVQNPTDTDAEIDMTFQTPDGEVQGPQETVLANQRVSYDVSTWVPNEWSVSTTVETADPAQQVVCERAMYWYSGFDNEIAQCAHASKGTNTFGTNWYLAEGSTGMTPYVPGAIDNSQAGNFETWILVQNPATVQANVQLTYQTPAGEVPGPFLTLEPQTRQTVNVADYVPDEWSVSTTVVSDNLVIAERSMYWNFPEECLLPGSPPYQWKRYCGHDSIGGTAPCDDWELAGMITGWADGTAGFDSWLLVQNPNNFDVDIDIMYVTSDGQIDGPAETLPANSRKSYRVGDTVPPGTESVGADVVTTGPVPEATIIVEHSAYWGSGQGLDPQSYRQAAWDSIGYPEMPFI